MITLEKTIKRKRREALVGTLSLT